MLLHQHPLFILSVSAQWLNLPYTAQCANERWVTMFPAKGRSWRHHDQTDSRDCEQAVKQDTPLSTSSETLSLMEVFSAFLPSNHNTWTLYKEQQRKAAQFPSSVKDGSSPHWNVCLPAEHGYSKTNIFRLLYRLLRVFLKAVLCYFFHSGWDNRAWTHST